MTLTNTDPAYFTKWSKQQLIAETVRLNKILKRIADGL